MTIAHWLMKLARFAAPENRTDWAHAMSAEFAALDASAKRTAWAAGCLSTVFAWRLQASALYLFALVALSVLWNVALGFWIFEASTTYAYDQDIPQLQQGRLWMALSGVATQSIVFVMSAALCAYRPRYAIVTIAAVWLGTTGASFSAMFAPNFLPLIISAPFSTVDNHPAVPNIVMAFIFFGGDMWPAICGALAGWALARGKRYTSAASAILAVTLIASFVNFITDPKEGYSLIAAFNMAVTSIVCAAFLAAMIWSLYTSTRDLNRAWRAAS